MSKQKKPRKIKFYIKDPTLKSSCTFFIGYSWKEILSIQEKMKHVDEQKFDPAMGDANGIAFKVRNKEGILCHGVWMPHFSWTASDIGVMSHEIIHLAGNILDHKGIPYRLENDEVFAYLHEHYFVSALRKLTPKK